MDGPPPQSQAPPTLQRQTASVQTPRPDPRCARNLLLRAYSKGWERLKEPQDLRRDHIQALRKTPIGRDFTLITTAGIRFNVHPIMFIGGSKKLEDGVYPGGVPQANAPTCVNLPEHFHPILVDRIVNFMYASDYHFDPAGRPITLKPQNFTFNNATFIPTEDVPSPATTALAGISNYMFHLRMYALAEELAYDALKTTALAKLVHLLVFRRQRFPSALKDVVDATFAPLGSEARICKDDDAILQNFAVAAVIAHETNDWDESHCNTFTESLQAPEYGPFWSAYQTVKKENEDLIKVQAIAKQAKIEGKARRRMAAEERRQGQIAKAGTSVRLNGSPLNTAGGIVKKRKGKGKEIWNLKSKEGGGGHGDGDLEMEMD